MTTRPQDGLRFTKMHGLGNDFVVFDAIRQDVRLTPERVRWIANRRLGVGCDQVLVVEPSTEAGVDFGYRIFNADGGEVQQCGNGARCFARFVQDEGLSAKDVLTVRTAGGLITLRRLASGDVQVNMGSIRLDPKTLPFVATGTALVHRLDVAGRAVEITALSIGNPHAVQIVEDVDTAAVQVDGPLIERHTRFPEGVNAGFMQIVDRRTIRLRVYERGAGETEACGSGACAAVAAGRLRGLLDDEVIVHLRGGLLTIRFDGVGPVWMEGPACRVYEGRLWAWGGDHEAIE